MTPRYFCETHRRFRLLLAMLEKNRYQDNAP